MAKMGRLRFPSTDLTQMAKGDMFYYDEKSTTPGWQRLTPGAGGTKLTVTLIGVAPNDRLLPRWG